MKRNLLAFSLLALAARAHADTDVRNVGAFTAIDLAGTMVVTAKIGPSKVEVVGDADLLPYVTTTVKNGVLVVDTPRDFPKTKRKNMKLEVVVSTPSLSAVTISGTGTISVEGLAAKSLVASIPGTGSLALGGKTERLQLSVSGTGEIKAKDLVAGDVEVDIAGTTQALLHATRSFDADVDGTAVVKVYGKPKNVRKDVDGTAVIDLK